MSPLQSLQEKRLVPDELYQKADQPEATKTSLSRWLDKQTVVHPDHGRLLGNKNG